MTTASQTVAERKIYYPDSDGKPMAETPIHRQNLTDLIEVVDLRFAGVPDLYVSGNMMFYYVEGDPKKCISPDVFVVRGVDKKAERRSYFVWKEKAPDLVIELTSRKTRKKDTVEKFELYRDVLRVREYFLFDPLDQYLWPPLQGFRLIDGRYVRIEPVDGRLPSEVLGLHLERDGQTLRLYDPETGQWVLTGREASEQAELRLIQSEGRRRRAEDERRQEAEARLRAEAEAEALRREVEALRRQLSSTPDPEAPPC